MNPTTALVFCLIFVVAVQADYQLSQSGKDCITETKIDETTVKNYVTKLDLIPEDDSAMEKFLECCYRNFMNDSNELIIDDKLITHVSHIFTVALEGRTKMAELSARDAVQNCKDVKGDNKGQTAMKMTNCLKKQLSKYIEKE